MFIGHFAVAFGAKKIAPKVSLGGLFLTAQFVDLLWPLLLLAGLEHARIAPGDTAFTPIDFYDYPISHSLVGSLAWSVAIGLLGFRIYRTRKAAVVLGVCVLSHWFLDLIVHRPDLPLLFNDGPKLGFSLWNHVTATTVLEMSLFAAGLGLYLTSTKSKDRIGSIGLWALIAFLLAIAIANMTGPPPPSIVAVALAGNLQWIFVAWAYWVDRHRISLETHGA